MKSISVLGCGWLGMPLGEEMVKRGYNVNGSTRSEGKLQEIASKGMKPFVVDLASRDRLPVEFFDSEVIVLNVPPSNAQSEEAYLRQLDNFLSIISAENHVVFISSTGVYPNLNRLVTEEDADVTVKSRSGISLLKAERKFQNPLHTTLRFGGLIDQRRHPGRWFAGKKNLKGGNVPINMIHLDDCIGAIQTIIDDSHWGEIFNICHPEHPKKSVYYTAMSEQLGLKPPEYDPNSNSSWKIISSENFLATTDYKFCGGIWSL